MIPSKLFLRNFMCYRDNVPPLYFDGIHLACLCGDNGNGKSALLDAITWALWGKSRAKSDDELIHLGKREMEVEFDFKVGEDRYRVLRKRTKTKLENPGRTSLDLSVNTKEGFKLDSGNSLWETQQKILRILRMDYLTFTNSVFLRQGNADEFTIKPPGERKKVLADILNLSFYEELVERAKGYANEREQQQKVLQGTIEEMRQEIERKGEYEADLLEVREALADLEKAVQDQESQVITMRETRKALDYKQEQLIELEKTMQQATEELRRWQDRFKEHKQRVEEYEKAFQQHSDVEEGYTRLLKVRKENEELNLKLGTSFALTKRKDDLLQAVNEAKGKLLENRGRVQSRADELEAKSKEINKLEGELIKAQGRLNGVAEEEKGLVRKKQQAQDLALQIQHLKSANAQLKQELQELEDKLAMLMQGEAKCPLCMTDLGIEGKQRIEGKYREEAATKVDTQCRNETELKEMEREYRELGQRISQWELRIDQEKALGQSQRATLEREISLSKEAAIELTKVRVSLIELEEKLARGDFASNEQQALEEVRKRIADLGYYAAKHQEVQQVLAGLERYEGLQRKLEEAERSLPWEKAALDQTNEAINKWSSIIEKHREKEAALSDELAARPELVRKLNDAGQFYNSLRQQQTEVRDKMVAIQEKVARCYELEQKKQGKEKSMLKALKEKGIYDELAEAFGKKGIQAFLIESAIPEIEKEASMLLGRMTDNRMQVNIETQRETKKGETIETLEIKISDELGTRNYEMYSGGEAFRINFALRIALSKLLARRAGAPLPILFIDEGFGTQDSRGLVKLVEAINSIQDDFEKIIVITHLEELKDAFPIRIEVTKTAEGSTISLS
ncbi:AAA family ATPase [Chloroflexota bacterium]